MNHWVNVGTGCVCDPYSEGLLKSSEWLCVKLHQSSLITTRARVEAGITFMTSSTRKWLDCIRQSHTESLRRLV